MHIPAKRCPPADKVIVLFDADILVYRAGFAAEKREYWAGDSPRFSSAKEMKQWCRSIGVPESLIQWRRNPEPEAHAIKNLQGTIAKTLGELATGFRTDDVEALFFLTGCDKTQNFREVVAHGYKANRDPKNKPTHYEALRAAIKADYPTVMTEGAETDDYLCPASKDIEAKFESSGINVAVVIASIDKDLLCVPGLHYNFVKKELHLIDENEANLQFFSMMLIGDKADNITGITGVGPVGATKLLKPHMESPDDMARKCMRKYKVQYPTTWLQEWNENCHMLWIWREMPDVCPYVFDNEEAALKFIVDDPPF